MDLLRQGKRRLIPLQQKLARKLHDLTYLFLELTNRCNLDCLHCGSDCTRSSAIPDLPRSSVLEVLREIAFRYDPSRITVVLSGGEPLCYPGVFDLGGAISDLGFPWGMVTNGWGWSRRKVIQANAAGMRTATVSLDGLEGAHDWLRSRRGSFKKAVETIRLLLEGAFLGALDVITCVHKRNLDDLDPLHSLLSGLGVPSWRLFTISPIGRAVGQAELFLSVDEYRTLVEKTLQLRRRDGVSVGFSGCSYLGPHLELEVCDRYFFCRAGINIAGILVNGDILACPNIDRRFKQGNIHTDTFVDVWEKRYAPFRERDWMRTGECQDCSEWAMCQGNSFHLRDFDSRLLSLCEAKRYNLLEAKG